MIIQWALSIKQYLSELVGSRHEGQGLVEYALIILLIALVVIGALALFGQELNDTFSYIISEFPTP